ncbi:MAG: Crp/Fnr family transcriptional regulator, partial [Bacteroidota bacterium]
AKRWAQLDEAELQLLTEVARLKTLVKGDRLLLPGQVCQAVYFVAAGNLYQYQLDDEQLQSIIDLHLPGDWALDARSFTGQVPSQLYLEAYTAASVFELSIHDLHALIARSPRFHQLGRILSAAVDRLQFFDQQSTPDEKYQHILQHQPDLLQQFPQRMLASYLKMTPETLSRVRRRLLS